MPDLILTSPLLSPFDEGVLAEYLREIGPAGAHVQTLRIPVLDVAKPTARSLFSFGRKRRIFIDGLLCACGTRVPRCDAYLCTRVRTGTVHVA